MRTDVVAVLVLSALAFSAQASSGTKQDDIARREMIQAGIKACKEKRLSTVGEYDSCVNEYSEEARKLYPKRGTDEYAKKHYGGLSSAQAESQLLKLQREYESAEPAGYFSSRRKPGSVSQLAIQKEGWWIQKNILGSRVIEGGDPFFIECKGGGGSAGTIRVCPLGKGGAR